MLGQLRKPVRGKCPPPPLYQRFFRNCSSLPAKWLLSLLTLKSFILLTLFTYLASSLDALCDNALYKLTPTFAECGCVWFVRQTKTLSSEQRTSLDNLVDHVGVSVRLLKLGGRDPDLTVSRNVFARLVQHTTRVVVAFEPSQCQPQLRATRQCIFIIRKYAYSS